MATRNNDKIAAIGKLMVFLFFVVALALIVSIKLGYTREGAVEVSKVEKFEKTSGDSNGFSTELKYFVYTDQGIFQIEFQGLNAYPYGLQLIGRDLPKTVFVKTRGARLEWLGVYPNIIEVTENYE